MKAITNFSVGVAITLAFWSAGVTASGCLIALCEWLSGQEFPNADPRFLRELALIGVGQILAGGTAGVIFREGK